MWSGLFFYLLSYSLLPTSLALIWTSPEKVMVVSTFSCLRACTLLQSEILRDQQLFFAGLDERLFHSLATGLTISVD